MRKEFAVAMEKLGRNDPNQVFLTGDLGFMALEKVREIWGRRFINAGVAEQNMISVAAGMAHTGLRPWVYSIAPFAVLRPYEQIRNDVGLHGLPVKIVGNGGGFGYGIMGATHHTLEDLALMRAVPNMKVYLPCFSADVEEAVNQMARDPHPNYLRLNLAADTAVSVESFRAWRKLRKGTRALVIAAGPVAGNLLALNSPEIDEALEVWVLGQLPVDTIPAELMESLKQKKKIAVLEEHGAAGGVGEMLAALLGRTAGFDFKYESWSASGYVSGRYGSQRWHQEENSLAGDSLLKQAQRFLNG